MKLTLLPNPKEWNALCDRPVFDQSQLELSVKEIIESVRQSGDEALNAYSLQFDNLKIENFLVTKEEIELAENQISQELKNAILLAKSNIEKFHVSQLEASKVIETSVGVNCWRKSVGIEKVGLYIPGGTAPLFSTILMLGIPAQIAGCKEVILCSPPQKNGSLNPAILYAANLVGITKIFKVGGAQAIAAMAYGTDQIPQVYKIFGPGNQFVTKAKELIQQEGIAIDMPAGPSEVLIIADESCNPSFVAADLLSQAEHGSDSQVILLSDSIDIIQDVMMELEQQIEQLPRKEIAVKALNNSRAIQLNSIKECIDFSNNYAPEHLIIASEIADKYVDSIINAGSVFLGNYSCESAGDYASGTNHTLPTNGYAKSYSGVSLDSFVRKITFQFINKEGIQKIGPAIELMAEAEELFAHKNAVSLRLKFIQND